MSTVPPQPSSKPPFLLQSSSTPTSETTTSLFIALTTLLLLPLLALLYIRHDYHSFLSLGPGGTPSTPLGYLKIKLLSLFILRDPLRPAPIPPHYRPQTGYLSSSLPLRSGPRPRIAGIAPQRQQSQKSPQKVYASLVSRMRALARDPENNLHEKSSCFEKHSSGLFSDTPITRVCGGEICHAHPSDGSIHLTLHPADAKVVIEAGWGERHPLARGGWFRRFVPKEFMLVYAPRSEEEVRVVMGIVAASVWWVSGMDVEKGQRGPRVSGGLLGEAEGHGCWACGPGIRGSGSGGGKKTMDKMVGGA